MIRNTLRTTTLLIAAAAALIGPAQAGGFKEARGGGHGIAVGEPHPGQGHGGGFGHGGFGHGGFGHGGWWSHGFGRSYIGFGFVPPYDSCYTERLVDDAGDLVLRRVCD